MLPYSSIGGPDDVQHTLTNHYSRDLRQAFQTVMTAMVTTPHLVVGHSWLYRIDAEYGPNHRAGLCPIRGDGTAD